MCFAELLITFKKDAILIIKLFLKISGKIEEKFKFFTRGIYHVHIYVYILLLNTLNLPNI